MSLKSDRWIRAQCIPPTHAITDINGCHEFASQTHDGDTHRFKRISEASKMLDEIEMENPGSVGDLPSVGVDYMSPISENSLQFWKPMIEPFSDKLVRQCETTDRRIISYGLSSYGYDARLAEELKLFTNINSGMIDPYALDEKCYVDAEIKTDEHGQRYAVLPPNSFMLGRTVEYFRIPRDTTVICLGKSTWARSGVTVVVTPLEPEWHGNVVIEIANLTNLPVKIYTGVGICQFLFLGGDQPCEVSYADRGGKYNGQTGITMPKV